MKGADIAEDAVDAVKRRPVATGGIIAAIAMSGSSLLVTGNALRAGAGSGLSPAAQQPRPSASEGARSNVGAAA